MRIAIHSDFPYRSDGRELTGEQPVLGFYAAVARAAGDAILLGRLDPEPGRYPYAVPPGLLLAALPHYGGLGPDAARTFRTALRRFTRVLRDADVVWLLGPHPLGVLFALSARARGVPVVLGVRQHLPDYFRRRHPDSRLAVLAGASLEAAWRALARRMPVVAVGPDLAAGYRHAPAVLDVAFSLVDEADVLDDARRDWSGDLVAVSVGRLDPEKNPLLLADVLARLPERWRLVVCGDGSEREALEARLAALGVSHRAELRGHVPAGPALQAVYREAHALLHVSWTEGLPQILTEAWAARTAVVATAVGGVGAVAEGAALLVAPGDADAPARMLERLAADAEERGRLIDAGTARVRTRTKQVEAARVSAFLREWSA